MNILTLKGNGKSKLLMQLMNECESKRALKIKSRNPLGL